MHLNLSTAAAPDASPDELRDACVRRGVDGVELVLESPRSALADEWLRAAEEGSLPLCGIYRSTPLEADARELAQLSARLDVPIVAPFGNIGCGRIEALSRTFTRAGGTLLVVAPSEPAAFELLDRCLAADGLRGIGLAWDLKPAEDDPILVAQVLAAAGGRLRYIRLHGGGPETAGQAGRGIGSLFSRLAIARFAGPLVLLPTDPRFHYAWRAWLGRAGGWGCGSKQSDPIPIRPSLAAPVTP